MFEFIILSVIALAFGYWVTLFLMGRRDDVLHGHFVQIDARAEVPSISSPAANAVHADSLQALLTAIKQDLKDAAQI
jgi:hypothetical protein